MTSDTDLSLDDIVAREEFEAANNGGRGDGDRQSGSNGIVLPWWQHPANIVTLIVTAALLAAMVGWMVGDSRSVRHNDIDTGFLQDMRTHHEQAVTMGIIYRNLPDTDPGLRAVARSIVTGQSIEVGRMIQLLRDFGETEANTTDSSMAWMGMVAGRESMPGMASDDELDRLGRSDGREADEIFVDLMTQHHLGGIEMAEFVMVEGENTEVNLMATSMAAAQTGEIGEMERLLAADG